MCDIIIRKNIKDAPKYVYKRVQKTLDGKYISPVMGQAIPFNRWMVAPKVPKEARIGDGRLFERIFSFKKKKNKKKFGFSPRVFGNSSLYNSFHDGKWGVFKFFNDARESNITNNFKDDRLDQTLKSVIVKCEIGGEIHQTRFDTMSMFGEGYPTFLAEKIKIIEEV